MIIKVDDSEQLSIEPFNGRQSNKASIGVTPFKGQASWLLTISKSNERVRVYFNPGIRQSFIVVGDAELLGKPWQILYDSADLS